MPPVPKVLNAFSNIRRIKVYRKHNIKQITYAKCHVTVSRKIKIQLKSISKCSYIGVKKR